MNYEALLGQKFGRLTPCEIVSRNSKGAFLRCKCDCGNEAIIRSDHMVRGESRSCGCWQKERAGEANRRTTPFTIVGDSAIGITTQSVEFLIDAEDLVKVEGKTWTVNACGYLATNIYAEGKTVLLHRLILGDYERGLCVDHIDRNKLNNKKSNLRLCRQRDNSKNIGLRSDNTSGHTGVYFNKQNGTWWAEITADGVRHSLGTFSKYEDAVTVREEAEKLFFGEFAPHLH